MAPAATAAQGFPDRRERFFGRKRDLNYLVGRAKYKGITAVAGRPQMGKSWLLNELARYLSSEYQPRFQVGFTESSGQTPDLLLRAVIDLYTRWLSDATYQQQARTIWEQQRGELIPNIGKAVGTIFKELSKSIGAESLGGIVKEAFEGLAAANKTLASGNIQIPPLQYEQARDLIQMVSRLGGGSVALVLDQWEQSSSVQFEATTLQTLLRHLEEWPHCHIFLGLRLEDPAHQRIKDVEHSLPGPCAVYELGLMELDDHGKDSIVKYLQKKVPAATAAEPRELLQMIDGYPGTIYRWTSEYQAEKMRSVQDLASVAEDAQKYRFRELDSILAALSEKERALAIRLALSRLATLDMWTALKETILDGHEDESLLDDLGWKKVLEANSPPSYGHAKRNEAAVAWFLKNRAHDTQRETESFVLKMAGHIKGLGREFVPYATALASFLDAPKALDGSRMASALCQSAASVLGKETGDSQRMLRAAAIARSGTDVRIVPLLAFGLHNTLIDAKGEHQLERREALLEELRGLARSYPDDSTARVTFAGGLYNTFNSAKEEQQLERRDALLEELREWARTYLDDSAVRNLLAKGLFNAFIDAKEEQKLEHRDALLEELRKLARTYPDDSAVRVTFACGLYNGLNNAEEEQKLEHRDALLEELRELARSYPDDSPIRENLAMGLCNTINRFKEEQQLERRDALLQELRELARSYPEDSTVREGLAKGVFNTLIDAKEEQNPERRDALLEELRDLARFYPEDSAVREQLARGLIVTVRDAEDEDRHIAKIKKARQELRTLAERFPNDAKLQEALGYMERFCG